MWRTIAEETDKDETLHQVKTTNGSIARCSPYHNILQDLAIWNYHQIKHNRGPYVFERKDITNNPSATVTHANCINTHNEKIHCINMM